MRLRMIGREGKGLAVARQRLLEAVEFAKNIAATKPSARKGGVDRQRLVVSSNGFVVTFS